MSVYNDEVRYSVKETSEILGISKKSLRYYDRIGLLAPYYRDPDNRYRYYTIKQFYQIELFKYAKFLGLPVPEYKSICITKNQVDAGDYHQIEDTLDSLLAQKLAEREQLNRCIAEVERMQQNLDVLRSSTIDGEPFEQKMPLRCAYAIDHDPSRPFEGTSVRMRMTRSKYQDHLTEQYGLLLDVEAAREGRLVIVKQYVVLDGYFDESEDVMHLPEGRYTNFLYHAFCPEEPLRSLARFLGDGQTRLPYLIADEVNYFEQVSEIVHAVRVLQ